MARNLPITEFDTLTINESMQMFKAMIPFLDYNLQKMLSIVIRMNEFQQTMNFYQNPTNCHQFSCCSNDHNFAAASSLNDLLSNEQFVNTVLQYCPEQYASMFQSFQQFSKMSDIMNMMNTGNDYFGPNAADIFRKFTSGDSGFESNSAPDQDTSTETQNEPEPDPVKEPEPASFQYASYHHNQDYGNESDDNWKNNAEERLSQQQTTNPERQSNQNQNRSRQSNFNAKANSSWQMNSNTQPNSGRQTNSNTQSNSGRQMNSNTQTNSNRQQEQGNNSNRNPSRQNGQMPSMNQIQNMAKNMSDLNPTDMFSSVMTPEQRKLYQEYVSELDKIDFNK